MEEIPIEVHGLSRAIFSTLLNYPVPNSNGKIMFSPTVDRTVPKIPWNGQMYLQGVVQDSIYDVTA